MGVELFDVGFCQGEICKRESEVQHVRGMYGLGTSPHRYIKANVRDSVG